MITSSRSFSQRLHLVGLAFRIAVRRRPLGVGMHNECWGAVAASVARAKQQKVTDYYGISFSVFRHKIKDNKKANPSIRNQVMFIRTMRLAIGR